MSVDFIKKRHNANNILTAQKQQKQLSYFTQSSIQEEVTQAYLEQWANRNYAGSDFFLTWLKTVLKTQNFLSFFKQLRNPIPSAKLINDEIVPQLKRVFHAEDSYTRYFVGGKSVNEPEYLKKSEFIQKIFNALLFSHNDIVISDLEDINKPYRELVSINNVISIDDYCGVIRKIAYTAEIETENGDKIQGFAYMDDKFYIFYDRDYNELIKSPHDLKQCPADYISSEEMQKNVVRKSIFSYVRPELEEYVTLRTIQKMTDLNGAIPVIAKMKTIDVNKNIDKKGESDKEQMSASQQIGSQQATISADVNKSKSPAQPGTIIEVPMIKDTDGRINMDVVKNYLTFHYMPVESLTFLNDRIKELKSNIISSLLGDYEEQNQESKNELQVSKSYVNKQDKLRWVSNELTRICNLSDYKTMALEHGADEVFVDQFFGSDFFLETGSDLMKDFALAPNAIIRRNILSKLAQTTNKFNKLKGDREKLLYKLLPFAADKDFSTALEQQIVGEEVKVLQIRFDYWITMFEANYGDILIFYNEMQEYKESERLILINNLLTEIIKENEPKKTSAPSGVQG